MNELVVVVGNRYKHSDGVLTQRFCGLDEHDWHESV